MYKKIVLISSLLLFVGLLLCRSLPLPEVNAGSGGSSTNYILTLQFQGTGSVKLNPPNITYSSPTTRSYAKNTVVTLTASAPAGWIFDHWEGAHTGDNDVKSVTMSGHKTMKAVFVQYRLKVTAEGDGQVHISQPDATRWPTFKEVYSTPTTVTVTAVPLENWAFTGWTGDLTGDAMSGTVVVDSPRSVHATFDQAWLFIQMEGNGSVSRSPVGETLSNSTKAYALGAHVTLTAEPDPGWVFEGWTGDLTGSVNPSGLDMLTNKDVTATFVADEIPPVITRTGAATVYAQCGGTYNDAGATATDNADGNITSEIVTTGGPGNTSAPGTYTVAYNVTDQAGNAATQVTRTVIITGDTTAPVITLLGPNPVYIHRYGTYNEYGATATDSCDPYLLEAAVDSTDVDTSAYGSYTVLYSLSDSGGNTAHKTRTVVVAPPPTVSFESISTSVSESSGTVTLPLNVSNHETASWIVWYGFSGSATSGSDFTVSGTSIVVTTPGQAANAAIQVPILNDTLDEEDETVIVTLQSASEAGLTSPTVHTLTIQDDDGPLVASFTADPLSGAAPLEVTFTDTSTTESGPITGWQWDFGDSTGSTAQHPVHTYTDPGVYTVSLTVETAVEDDTEIREGYIDVGGDGSLISVSPSLIQFGYVAIGQSKTLPVTIRNEGEDWLVGTASVEAPFSFSVASDPNYAIPPEGEVVLNIVYTPTAAVESHDVLGLPGGGNAQVAVYGSAIAPEPESPAGVRLNELVVWNTSGVVSANGEYVDWIELYNENNHAMDIGGWTLTDDDADPDKYTLPAGTAIGPNGFLLVYASTETASLPGELHTGFALDEVNGGYLGLFAPIGGTPTLMSEVEYPAAAEPDRSYGLMNEENKQLLGWGSGILTSLAANIQHRNWPFVVYGTIGVTQGTLPDPSLNTAQYDPGEPSHQVFIEDWLLHVQNFASTAVMDDSKPAPRVVISPLNPPNSVTISQDVTANVSPIFLNRTMPSTIHNMPGNLTLYSHLFKAVNNVTDRAAIVVATMDIFIGGQPTPRVELGRCVFTTQKAVMFLASKKIDTILNLKWHPANFVHEWGHYTGLVGHPNVLDERDIMYGTVLSISTGQHEPWFHLAISPIERSFFEGQHWSSPQQRRQHPPMIKSFFQSEEEAQMTVIFQDAQVEAETPW